MTMCMGLSRPKFNNFLPFVELGLVSNIHCHGLNKLHLLVPFLSFCAISYLEAQSFHDMLEKKLKYLC